MNITKRDGSIEKFDINKIINAVSKAYKSEGYTINDDIIDELKNLTTTYISDNISVEKIQDEVEQILMDNAPFDVAKAYITYREKHKQSRLIRERIDYMNKYSQSNDNAASSSETDGNSNVTIKNVANLEGEVYKTTNRIIQRQRMKDKLNEMFPEVAKQYEEDLNHHIIYTHDEASTPVLKNYCMAVSLYPLIEYGTSTMDGLKASAPKNLDSFCGQFVNLVFLLSSQCKGAVGFGEFFNFFDYYCAKEWGPNYHLKEDIIVDTDYVVNPKTIGQKIEQYFQQVVYSLNQPAGNRSYQSPFTNFNYFDSNYWHSLFDDFCFPDGSKPVWERVDFLQRKFMNWFNEERTKTLLTYPVESMCLLHDGKDVIDKSYKDLAAEMWSKGHSFFVYLSDNPDAVASCCFSKDTKFLWKSSTSEVHISTFKEFLDLPYKQTKENFKVFHNGSWIKGKIISLPNRQMYKVITYNNKEFIMSDNHINVTYDGEKRTEDLTTDDYLMFNTSTLSPVTENNEHLTYEQGLLIGLFLGDGTFGNYVCLDGSVHSFQLSLNKEKWEKVQNHLSKIGDFRLGTIYNNVYPIHCYNKELTTFIAKWTGNEPNKTSALNKSLNLDCFLQSVEFRRGILDGWYITDGGNSNRCYTISKHLVERMEALCTTLGLQTILNISDRTDEAVIIRGQEFNRNYPLYCLRWYVDANHRCNKTKDKSWKKKNNSIYWKIKSIEPIEYKDNIYCVQCDNQDEPYFTLPNGLITHNCRLRNEVVNNTFSSTTGLTGVQTGSVNVITLNLNRIVQDWYKEYNKSKDKFDLDTLKPSFKAYLLKILERVYKYQVAYKTMLFELEKQGMLTASKAGYISMKKLFSTIGVNGFNEMAQFMGLKVSNNTEYKDFIAYVFNIISTFCKEKSTKNYLFNLEVVPAESLGSKNYNWDKKDGYIVPNNEVLYNSYIYDAHDPNTSVLDKFVLQGGKVAKASSGGQALHCNLEDHLSKEQYLKLIEFAIQKGTSYFTFNIPNSQCDNCGFITKHPIKKCPICGSNNITQWTRTIGYLRPIKAMDYYRQIEANNRVYSKTI